MPKSKKKKPFKFSYIQNWGTYSNETYVAVGLNKAEIVQSLKDWKSKAKVIEIFERNCKESNFTASGFVHYQRETGATLLIFPKWKNNWYYWDTLVHEISHLIFFIMGDQKAMGDETEAMAYQHEFLFREIRRSIWNRTSNANLLTYGQQ